MISSTDGIRENIGGPRLWILVETTVRESQRAGVGIEKLTREWEWEGVGLPNVASITLRYVIADIIARLWVAAIDSSSARVCLVWW